MFSLNFMFFCSLIEELCTKEENYKTSCNFNFGHECRSEMPFEIIHHLDRNSVILLIMLQRTFIQNNVQNVIIYNL